MSTVPAASLTWLRPEVADLQRRLNTFVENECVPAEALFEAHMRNRHGTERWTLDAIPPVLKQLQTKAKALGFWNMFLPKHLIPVVNRLDPLLVPSIPLSFREYGILCESLGRSPSLAPQACNCSAPDTGNMEVLLEFGTLEQQQMYGLPLLRGETRSAFLMTEPAVASSDATNLRTELIKIDEDYYQIKGRKWWSTGAMDPRCKLFLVVTKNQNPQSRHNSHTIVLVPKDSPGVVLEKALTVFGYDDAPSGHAQVLLNNVVVSKTNIIHGEGTGFLVSQARLGPGRIHHCMRAIGMASRAYELMLSRTLERQAFGKPLYEHGMTQEAIADSFADLKMARLLTLDCASALDQDGAQKSLAAIASLKFSVPQLCYLIVDRAVQIHGGLGLCGDTFLAQALAGLRSLRIADGPDDVHRRTVARIEAKRAIEACGRSRL